MKYELLKNDSEIRISLDFVDQGIDSGPIISQKKIKINYNLTFNKFIEAINRESASLISEYLSKIDNISNIKSISQSNLNDYYNRIKINDKLLHLKLKDTRETLSETD